MSEKRKTAKSNLTKLDALQDQNIDDTDIAATDDAFWAGAKIVMPPAKAPLSVRFDSDVIAWFKRQGRGYQTRMNAVLRAYMDAHKRRENRN